MKLIASEDFELNEDDLPLVNCRHFRARRRFRVFFYPLEITRISVLRRRNCAKKTNSVLSGLFIEINSF